MKLPVRKNTRLKEFDYSQNGAYFITICVKDRCTLLGEIIDREDINTVSKTKLSTYGIIVQKYINGIVGIDKYVIMPNHIHMIIFINDKNYGVTSSLPHTQMQSISQLVKSFKILVTKQIGFSLWQRSFYDHIIRNQNEYEMIWKYIDENPLKWKNEFFYISTNDK